MEFFETNFPSNLYFPFRDKTWGKTVKHVLFYSVQNWFPFLSLCYQALFYSYFQHEVIFLEH